MPRLAAPAIGSLIPADAGETLVVGQLLDGAPPDHMVLTARVLDVLRRGGHHVRREGNVVDDPAEAARLVGELVSNALGPRLDLLRLLGVVGDGNSDGPASYTSGPNS